MIRYGYIRNNTLFFVFTHPGAKQEFDIIAESIRRPLKEHPPAACRNCSFDTVKGFVSHRPPAAPSAPAAAKAQQLLYRERASGRFTNNVSSAKLHAMIEKIRAIIHARAD